MGVGVWGDRSWPRVGPWVLARAHGVGYQRMPIYVPSPERSSSMYYQMRHPGKGLSVCTIMCALLEGDYQPVILYAAFRKGIISMY